MIDGRGKPRQYDKVIYIRLPYQSQKHVTVRSFFAFAFFRFSALIRVVIDPCPSSFRSVHRFSKSPSPAGVAFFRNSFHSVHRLSALSFRSVFPLVARVAGVAGVAGRDGLIGRPALEDRPLPSTGIITLVKIDRSIPQASLAVSCTPGPPKERRQRKHSGIVCIARPEACFKRTQNVREKSGPTSSLKSGSYPMFDNHILRTASTAE